MRPVPARGGALHHREFGRAGAAAGGARPPARHLVRRSRDRRQAVARSRRVEVRVLRRAEFRESVRMRGLREASIMTEIRTERLILREWRDSDFEPFAALNGDRRVMEFFPAPLDRSASDALVLRIREGFARHPFGLWAVEAPGVAPFIGFIGLSVPRF